MSCPTSSTDRDAFEKIASGLRQASNSVDDELSLDWLAPPQHPEHLGRLHDYEIVDWVGRGGMGVVFKAFDAALKPIRGRHGARPPSGRPTAVHAGDSPAKRRQWRP